MEIDIYEQIELQKRKIELLKLINIGTIQRVELGILILKKNILSISEIIKSEVINENKIFKSNCDVFSKSELKYLKEHSIHLSLHFSAYLVLVYTFWDTHFKRFCQTIAYFHKIDFNFRDLQGKDNMRKGYGFLKHKMGYDLQIIDSDWNKLNTMKDIRDLIIHYDSRIIEVNKKRKDIIISNKYLNYNDSTGYFYISDKDLLLNYCRSIENFFRKITKLSEEKIYREIKALEKIENDKMKFDPDKFAEIINCKLKKNSK